jgi:hypothetical protein
LRGEDKMTDHGIDITTLRELTIGDTTLQLQKVEFTRPKKRIYYCVGINDYTCHNSVPFKTYKLAVAAFNAMSAFCPYEDEEV